MGQRRGGETYGVAGCEFLFCTGDVAGTLGSVDGSFTTDDGLTLRGAAVGFGADFGDGVPIV